MSGDAKRAIPAPWHIDPDDRPDMEHNNHILAANGNTVCFMAWSGDGSDNEAHEQAARLIAILPGLFDAACDVVNLMTDAAKQDSGAYLAFHRLEAAIAKARTP